jgi:hypothetical protein
MRDEFTSTVLESNADGEGEARSYNASWQTSLQHQTRGVSSFVRVPPTLSLSIVQNVLSVLWCLADYMLSRV